MGNFLKVAILSGAIIGSVQAANAVTGNVIFNADVQNTCVIAVTDAGQMTANVGQTQLSSTNAGGSPGKATIVSTSSAYKVSLDTPTAFTTMPTGGAASSFAASYSTTGATTLTNQSVQNPLATGTTNVTVNLSATKATGSFPTGLYAATVVLRCE